MKIFSFASSAMPLGALLALATIGPAVAAPMQQVPLPNVSNVEMVQATPGASYWHGYRGSRTERAGTRRHDGYWYPLAAFGVESGTTGSIANPAVRPMQRQTYCQNTFGGSNGDGSMPCDNGY